MSIAHAEVHVCMASKRTLHNGIFTVMCGSRPKLPTAAASRGWQPRASCRPKPVCQVAYGSCPLCARRTLMQYARLLRAAAAICHPLSSAGHHRVWTALRSLGSLALPVGNVHAHVVADCPCAVQMEELDFDGVGHQCCCCGGHIHQSCQVGRVRGCHCLWGYQAHCGLQV